MGYYSLREARRQLMRLSFPQGKKKPLVHDPCRLLMFFKNTQQSNTTPNNKAAQVCWALRETNVSTSLGALPRSRGVGAAGAAELPPALPRTPAHGPRGPRPLAGLCVARLCAALARETTARENGSGVFCRIHSKDKGWLRV